MENIEIINELRKDLPDTIAAIGYGSGFYRQKGYDKNEKPDKDIILVVDNLHRFLAEDYHMNPDHFYDGAERKYRSAEDKKTKFFYHKLGCLKFAKGDYNFKLLIVEKGALLYDVFSWKHFGLAARLSKPIVYNEIPADIDCAINYNRDCAIITALLSNSSDEITKRDLYKTISGLSYKGDWRMITHSEKETKAEDIVDGAFDKFEEMYGSNKLLKTNGEIIINNHPIDLIPYLPDNLREFILKNIDIKNIDVNNPRNLDFLAKAINDYFVITNMVNTPLVMYSCYKSLGASKAIGHALSKRKNAKGR